MSLLEPELSDPLATAQDTDDMAVNMPDLSQGGSLFALLAA